MKPILDKLHKDHVNFIKLLSFLEKQLHLLEEYKSVDLEAMHDAIRYMKEYPDQVHHPLEDVLFKYFITHHGLEQDKINKLLYEHEGMPALTEKLSLMLQDALMDVPQRRDELCEYMKKYITVQKEHMNIEEASVYPVIDSTLNEEDWVKIISELTDVEDPLFGNKVEKSFQGLLQQIIS